MKVGEGGEGGRGRKQVFGFGECGGGDIIDDHGAVMMMRFMVMGILLLAGMTMMITITLATKIERTRAIIITMKIIIITIMLI